MVTRHISLIAIIQVFALGCALLFAALAAKYCDLWNETLGGRPLPLFLERAHVFRDYGIWCCALIFLWVMTALHAARSPSSRSSLGIPAVGIGLALAWLFLAAVFLAVTLSPFRIL
jgi:hypothetical protein